MAQEQQQEPSAKEPSLITRVIGSRIAQAIGIFGVGFTLFQGLEPFLRFSRFMAYLVDHWRELTRGLWSWLASLVNLDLPAWVLDIMTAVLFIILFTARSWRYRVNWEQVARKSVVTSILEKIKGFSRPAVLIVIMYFILLLPINVVIFLSIYPHLPPPTPLEVHVGSYPALRVTLFVMWLAGAAYCALMATFERWGFILMSERAIYLLIWLLTLNYIASYSHTIEAFIEKATQ